jgi:hypothetical protein
MFISARKHAVHKFYLTPTSHKFPSPISYLKMPNFPHETLPLEQLSLSEFTYLMQQASNSEDELEFINTALCGRFTHQDRDCRVSLNARQELDHPAYPLFTRDFDSAIGITKNFPFLAALNVFPVPSFKETLKKGNHVKAHIVSHPLPPYIVLSSSLLHRVVILSH